MINTVILTSDEIFKLEEDFVAKNGRNSTDDEMIKMFRAAELKKVSQQQNFFREAATEWNKKNCK